MRTEEDIRQMYMDHKCRGPAENSDIEKLIKDNPGTTADYWKGYYDGVTDGYKIVLEEIK